MVHDYITVKLPGLASRCTICIKLGLGQGGGKVDSV